MSGEQRRMREGAEYGFSIAHAAKRLADVRYFLSHPWRYETTRNEAKNDARDFLRMARAWNKQAKFWREITGRGLPV